MSHDHLRSAMSELAQMAANGVAKPRLGTVTSYDGTAGGYAVKVMLQPEETETGWLPILTALAGSAYGVYYGPAIGDQALVLFQEGDVTSGICVGFLGSDDDPAPEVLTGEIHLIAKDDAAHVVMKPDGTISSKGAWTHTGTMHITDEVTADKSVTATVDVVGGGKHLKTHTHSGVTAGGGTSGPPS